VAFARVTAAVLVTVGLAALAIQIDYGRYLIK
jgi:hypothetical protein